MADLILLSLLAQTAPIDTTGFTADQRFVYLLVGQIVTLVGLGIPVVLALLKMWENSRKVDANTALTAATQVKLTEVGDNVDGKMSQLLAEKDERIGVAERAARAEGKLEGFTEATTAAPPVVPPVQVVVDPDARPGGRRKLDPPATSAPPDADPSGHGR